MTDREMLELVLHKVTGLTQDVTQLKQDVELIKTQQSEHGEILQSVRHAQETQKAQHDALQMEVANLSGEMRKGFTNIIEVQKSLIEMYGQHEVAIHSLQRRPV